MRIALLAAVLLIAACGTPDRQQNSQPLRHAAFRAASARDFLLSCPGMARRSEVRDALARFDGLRELAVRKGADYPIWTGGNDYAAMARQSTRERCLAGEIAYNEALAAYDGALGDLAHEIAEYRQ